jgi:hypothetical protein
MGTLRLLQMRVLAISCLGSFIFGCLLWGLFASEGATAYAEQNERDYQAMLSAVRGGRIKVYTES